MWVKQSSIRPVPSYAKVHEIVLSQVRAELHREELGSENRFDDYFQRFETAQPIVATRIGEVLNRPLGEAAIALGYFLSLVVWLAFERAHGAHLGQVTIAGFDSTRQLVELDESLRMEEAQDALETDDVISMEQPALVRFIQEQMTTTLDLHGGGIDPRHLASIYKVILIEVLALSYSVRAPIGFPNERTEALA